MIFSPRSMIFLKRMIVSNVFHTFDTMFFSYMHFDKKHFLNLKIMQHMIFSSA